MSIKLPLCGMAVKFNPHQPNCLALSMAENFGMVGSSALRVMNGQTVVCEMPSPNAIFDIAWSEASPELIAAACGDGMIRVAKVGSNVPVAQIKTHKKEINSIECSHHDPRMFLTGSVDSTSKITDLQAGKTIFTFIGHKGQVYESHFHPKNPDVLASAGQDGTARIWDIKTQKNVIAIPAHANEVLSCDFSKYEDILATGSGDNTIRLWDLRNVARPLFVLTGHRYAVKQVRYSPWKPNHLLSASFDMSVRLWDTKNFSAPLLKQHDKHHEFVQGIDWSPIIENQIASISWDTKLYTWMVNGEQPFLA